MRCSKCGGKLRVIDTADNEGNDRITRMRRCEDCNSLYFTTEAFIDTSKQRYHSEKYLAKLARKGLGI